MLKFFIKLKFIEITQIICFFFIFNFEKCFLSFLTQLHKFLSFSKSQLSWTNEFWL
jgi:hypothetical protein